MNGERNTAAMSFPRARCGRGKTNKLTSNTVSRRAQNHTREEKIGTRALWPRRGGARWPWRLGRDEIRARGQSKLVEVGKKGEGASQGASEAG